MEGVTTVVYSSYVNIARLYCISLTLLNLNCCLKNVDMQMTCEMSSRIKLSMLNCLYYDDEKNEKKAVFFVDPRINDPTTLKNLFSPPLSIVNVQNKKEKEAYHENAFKYLGFLSENDKNDDKQIQKII